MKRNDLGLTPEQQDAILRNPKQKAAFRILTWFAGRGAKGGTVDECEAALDLRHQSASPRVNELAHAGCLVITEERRETRSGKTARVYTYRQGSSFVAYLGMPPSSRVPKKPGLTLCEEAGLAAAMAYMSARRKAKSSAQIEKLIVRLLTTLNRVAQSPDSTV